MREDKAIGKEYAMLIIKNLTSLSEESSFVVENVSRDFQSLLVDVIKENTCESMSSRRKPTRRQSSTSKSDENELATIDSLLSLSGLIREEGLLGLESVKLLSELLSNEENCNLFTEYYLDLLPPIVSILKETQRLDMDGRTFDYCLIILINLSIVEESRILISNANLEVMGILGVIIQHNIHGKRRKALTIIQNVYTAERSSPFIRSPPNNLLRALVSLVSHNQEDRRKALEIICNMSVSTTYRKVLAMSSIGLVNELVNIMKTDEGQLRLEAFVSIGNLLSCQENIKKLISPTLGLIDVLLNWRASVDEKIPNEEETSLEYNIPLSVLIEQMIESLQCQSYNSEFPSLVQQLSPSLNRRSGYNNFN